MEFKEYKFGYADSDTELLREPIIFDKAFYDPREIIKEMIEGYKFLILGRKGTGKTAIGAKLDRISEKDTSLIVKRMHLSNFEFRTFSKIGSSLENGAKRHEAPWRLVLLLEVFSIINNMSELERTDKFNSVCNSLSRYGLISNDSLSRAIKTISKKEFKITLPFKLGGSYVNDDEIESELSSPEEICDTLQLSLKELSLEPRRMRIVIDGLDDTLRNKKNQVEIVSGLIRAANFLNNYFLKIDLSIKIIVLIRTDIFSLCNDPDLNKIKRDSGVDVSWNPSTVDLLDSDLMNLIKLRFKASGIEDSNSYHWYKLFPETIKDQDSWHLLLEHTLYRPRDVLQFLIECQRNYGSKTKLDTLEFNSVLSSYSKEYFLEEMKNELAGFIPDLCLNELATFLSRLDSRSFKFNKWEKTFGENNIFKDQNSKTFLEILFDNGYIGQLRPREGGRKTFVVFKYRGSHEKVNYNDQFIIHRGLWKALSF